MFGKKNRGANFRVAKASEEQIDLVFRYFYKDQSKREGAIVFVAVDSKESVVGYLLAEEKTVLAVNATDWFIWNIFTTPKLRRQGVAAAVLEETKKCAREAGVRHLLGSCTNTPAHMFWFKHNFCFIMYGQKIDNPKAPLEHGNYPHMIVYRLNKTEKENRQPKEVQIVQANNEQLHWIFDEHILHEGLKFFRDKGEDISGLSAIDSNGNLLGIITAYAYELGAPLEGTQWMIPYIYVRPELRRQGIGRSLINALIKTAEEAGIAQLTCLFITEDASAFLYHNHFDVCNYYIMGDVDGRRPITAALRIE